MQRDSYNAVTLPLLIEVPKQWSEGEVYFEDDRVRVREFTDDDIDRSLPCGKENWAQIPEREQKEILKVTEVIRALDSSDRLAAKQAMLALKALPQGPQGLVYQIASRMIEDPEYIPDSLVYQICRELDSVRLVLWKKLPKGQLAPGLFSRDIRALFWIRALMSALGAQAGVRICPKCGKTFWQKRRDQEYCSMKCREAHRVERWRAKNKIDDSQKVSRKPKARMHRGAK